MGGEKRKGDKPVPDNLNLLLNDLQKYKLHHLEGFGWHLEFVRRPLFQEPTIVVCSPDGRKIGTLEKDGSVNLNPDIKLRSDTLIPEIIQKVDLG